MVCLTLGRQSLLPLLLQRYADKPLHVVIVDGTSEPWVHQPDFSPGCLTWEYIHHPGPSIAKYFERFVLGLERVRTDFVVWGSDDDVILWDGIVLSINHLRTHPEHLLAGGRVIRVDPRTLSVHPWKHWGKPLHIEGMPMARVLKVMSTQRTANYCYQVYRTSALRHVARYFISIDSVPNSGAGECLLALSLAFLSPFELGEYPYWVRVAYAPRGEKTEHDASQVIAKGGAAVIAETLARVVRSWPDSELASSRLQVSEITQGLLTMGGARGSEGDASPALASDRTPSSVGLTLVLRRWRPRPGGFVSRLGGLIWMIRVSLINLMIRIRIKCTRERMRDDSGDCCLLSRPRCIDCSHWRAVVTEYEQVLSTR